MSIGSRESQISRNNPNFLIHLCGGIAIGLALAAAYVYCVAVLGIGRPMGTGSAWLTSLIVSLPSPQQVIAIFVLYTFYGTIAGLGLGAASYLISRSRSRSGA